GVRGRMGPMGVAGGRDASRSAASRPVVARPSLGTRGARARTRSAGAPGCDGPAGAVPRPRLSGGALLDPPAAARDRGRPRRDPLAGYSERAVEMVRIARRAYP